MSLDKMKKKETKRKLTLAMGLITAVMVVVTQLFFFQVQEPSSKKEVAAAQHEDSSTSSSSEEAYFTMPSSTLPSSNHVEVHQETFFLIEILFGEEDSSVSFEIVTKPVSQWLFTLFRTAISPNAP